MSYIQKFRESSFVFEKPSILSENFDELQLSYSSIFFAENSHTFSADHCLKRNLWDFFLFYLDHELFPKLKKEPGF